MTLTATAPLTVRDTLALAVIINASMRQDKVVYLRENGQVELKGVARGLYIGADIDSLRPFGQGDVRDAWLHITLSSGFEGFYPVADLVTAEKAREFVVYDWS